MDKDWIITGKELKLNRYEKIKTNDLGEYIPNILWGGKSNNTTTKRVNQNRQGD